MNAAPDPDAALTAALGRLPQGDRDALARVYRLAGPKLFAICLRILSDRAEAEDALQEIMVRIWRNAARFDPEKGNAMAWVCAIARNHAIDRLRRRPRAQAAAQGAVDPLEMLADPAPGAEALLTMQADMRRVLACMGELPPDRARAVQGAYLQGQSYQDLADRHGVPLNTMRTWLRRALASLRECLER